MKISELWSEVEAALNEKTASGSKQAILEAHKVLKAVLDAKRYPGKKIEKQLFWAGYSLKEREGFAESLKKHQEILENFSYGLTDIETEDIVKKYHNVIQDVSKLPDFGFSDRVRMTVDVYLRPNSLLFWRNVAIIFGTLIVVKILTYSQVGKTVFKNIIWLADFVISWQFLIFGLIVIGLMLTINAFLANRSKIRIKE